MKWLNRTCTWTPGPGSVPGPGPASFRRTRVAHARGQNGLLKCAGIPIEKSLNSDILFYKGNITNYFKVTVTRTRTCLGTMTPGPGPGPGPPWGPGQPREARPGLLRAVHDLDPFGVAPTGPGVPSDALRAR